MKRAFFGLLMALAAAFTSACGDGDSNKTPTEMEAADVSGTWLGTLQLEGASLRIVFNIARSTEGGFTGTADSPDQGGFGIPLTRVEVVANRVTLRIASIDLVFSGELSADGLSISGSLVQGGDAYALVLKKQPGPLDYRRPQDPIAPFPYKSADVTFPSDDPSVSLAGTLVWPKGAGPFTAVVLISGSGPQNRNEELLNHRPFLVLADALARENVAVLRYDDRGVGGSSGAFGAATTEDFARDARGAVHFLASQSHFALGSIGLVGHSEGGEIAPMAAEDNTDVKFLVLMAGPGVDGKTTLLAQNRAMEAARGASAADLDAHDAQRKAAYDCFDTTDLDGCLRQQLESSNASAAEINAAIAQLDTPWMRFFVSYDPVPVLRRTRIPVLALNGSLDLQVLPDLNLPAIDEALREAGNEQRTIQKLPGLNHLFQHAVTGLPDEYASIDETMAPEAMSLIASWIHQTAP